MNLFKILFGKNTNKNEFEVADGFIQKLLEEYSKCIEKKENPEDVEYFFLEILDRLPNFAATHQHLCKVAYLSTIYSYKSDAILSFLKKTNFNLSVFGEISGISDSHSLIQLKDIDNSWKIPVIYTVDIRCRKEHDKFVSKLQEKEHIKVRTEVSEKLRLIESDIPLFDNRILLSNQNNILISTISQQQIKYTLTTFLI